MTDDQPTPTEQRAYGEMQARMVALLLRFDEAGFVRRYGPRDGSPPDAPGALQPYRDLAAVTLLRDELFGDILPRIVRRLSFESPRQMIVEEAPPRGRIDWERTLDAAWATLPGLPPLELHTRQRRRDFATPENLLTVAVLLEYHAALRGLLWDSQVVAQSETLRHPLGAIVEQCERELAFPQFASIRADAEQALAAGEIATLAHRVQERAIPGGNSAYADLIAWRVRLLGLPLLQRGGLVAPVATLGADPNADNYLYQLWIFYELLSLLEERACIVPGSLTRDPLGVRFRWGDCTYALHHDQAVPQPTVAGWADQHGDPTWAPGVRPDFYIQRVDPPPIAVQGAGGAIWREPGVIWDAKYYRERERTKAPSSPIKRMIADLNLLGEPYGILLFAFLQDAEATSGNYALRPDPAHRETLVPQQTVVIRQLRPALPGRESGVQTILALLLNDAHQRLKTPTVIRCHGVFLDSLTVNAHGTLADAVGLRQRDGTPVAGAAAAGTLDTLLFCPKPHIGPWRVDLVSLEHDCCANPQHCHPYGAGVPAMRPPSRPTRLEDVVAAIRASGEDDEGARAEAATRHVRVVAQRYADLIQPDLPAFTSWVREQLDVDDAFAQFPHLTDAHRETLGLGRFLWQQIEAIRATNFAGPALLFSGVLEDLARQTIFTHCPPLIDDGGRTLPKTLGVLGHPQNRAAVRQALDAGQHWQGERATPVPLTFDSWAELVKGIALIRNKAAHAAHISQDEFRELQVRYFGSTRTGYGALNGLLLAWRER